MLETYPFLSLLPPLVAIVLVIISKRVLPSLGAGIVAAALLVADFKPMATLKALWDAIVGLWWADGSVNWYSIFIISFLLELGVLTSLMLMSGGTQAFSNWAGKRIKSRRGAQFFVGILGICLFIDDYFNALAVGQIARPVTDKYKVSHAKLAYLIHTSAAPVVVLSPFSSWGATIIGIIAPILAASTLTMSYFEAFIQAAFMNYYAIGSVVGLWLLVGFAGGFGKMRIEEERAVSGGGLISPDEKAPGQLSEAITANESGYIRSLVVPFALLLFGAITGMYVTGGINAGDWAPMAVLANADVALALNVGGILAVISAAVFLMRHTQGNPAFEGNVRVKGAWEGAKSIMPAILILIFAWLLAALVGQLGTGEYLASLVEGGAISGAWLVPALFVFAGIIAFATGTSWGSFGILLPIAGEMMSAVPGGDALLIPAFGAVLAGAVLGDHTSPISDTTILSATSAGCAVPTHVVTQLPIALSVAASALLGYVACSATGIGWIGLLVTLAGVFTVAFVTRNKLPA